MLDEFWQIGVLGKAKVHPTRLTPDVHVAPACSQLLSGDKQQGRPLLRQGPVMAGGVVVSDCEDLEPSRFGCSDQIARRAFGVAVMDGCGCEGHRGTSLHRCAEAYM